MPIRLLTFEILLIILQEVKDIYLFGIVGMLVAVDIIFLIPVTTVPEAILRREYEEIEGDNVSIFYNISTVSLCSYYVLYD